MKMASFNQLRKLFVAGLCLVATLALAVPVHADAVFVVSNGDVEMDTDGLQAATAPPLVDITRLSLQGGRLYTNQVDGIPFTSGTVRTVGIITVGSAVNGSNFPAYLPDGSSLNFIFGVEGHIIAPGVAQFTSGRVFLASLSTGNPEAYDLNHATTWNFDNVFAEFGLLSPMEVIDGALHGITGHTGTAADGSGHVAFPEAIVNKSAVNGVIFGGVQGVFLFGEDSTADQNAGAGFTDPGIVPFSGDEWLRNVDDAEAFPKALEGMVITTNHGVLGNFATAPNAADLIVLNEIAQRAFGANFDENGYTPSGIPNASGDFIADLTGEAYIGYATPEPSSLLIFALGGGLFAFGARRRLSKANAPVAGDA